MLLETKNKNNEIKLCHSLIEPDYVDEWFIRYTWIQHKTDNDSYLNNYFTDGSSKGLNVRAQSQHLSEYWKGFNYYMTISGQNGDLVWRIKTLNSINKSIDYVEVWRSKQAIHKIIALKDILLPNGFLWRAEHKTNLGKGIGDVGFETRRLTSIPGISRESAVKAYEHFVERWKNKDNCIINTPYRQNLNPYR